MTPDYSDYLGTNIFTVDDYYQVTTANTVGLYQYCGNARFIEVDAGIPEPGFKIKRPNWYEPPPVIILIYPPGEPPPIIWRLLPPIRAPT